jgi:hypothetical protein
MEIHVDAKGSYLQELKFLAAIKRKLPDGTFGFPSAKDLVEYKRGLKVPMLQVFMSPKGQL